MPRSISTGARRLRLGVAIASLAGLGALGASLTLAGSSAAASPTTVGLGTAGNFAVLAGTGITDSPPSPITGNVGLSPGTSDGISCAEVTGTVYSVSLVSGPLPCRKVDAPLLGIARGAAAGAYTDAASRTGALALAGAAGQLDGKTLVGGVYSFTGGGGANLSTNASVTLTGSASSVWIFQINNNLTFASSSRVLLAGGAQACNVFWQVGSDAALGTNSNIVGTILAGTSIAAATGAHITGRLLADAAVTLDHNTITRPTCGSSGGSSQQPPGRALYCSPSGQSYDLVQGENLEPPYDALGLVPATIDPVTGSASCSAAAAPTTTAEATTTTATATVPPPPPVTTTATTPKAAAGPPAKKAKGVKAAKHTNAAHVTPQPAKHTAGFTG